ncbi:hypothetical protein ACK8HX_05035 [Oryzobacter sp. R7]|uniref:hypothetical protein n=1 Tax=Oryzobacter faecalis TaxID=3388656 RepID=UPI00398CDC90
MSWQLKAAMQATVKNNVPRPPIAEQGVMEPPLAVPARIEDASGAGLTGAVLIREGSTRVSHAQEILGVSARDLLVGYVDDREQAQLIRRLNATAQSSASRITPEEASRVRVATMPVDLVVGVEPDSGSDTTLGEAVAAKVAQDHLNHKQQWDPAAKDVHLGESCLIALHDESLLTDERYAWLAGRVPAGTSVIDGDPIYEDDRWAELLWTFTTKKRPESVVIRRPIATVLERDQGRQQVSNRKDRVPLAVALAMRARRGLITETAVERESRALEASVPSEAWDVTWQPTTTSLKDLAAKAVEAAESRVRSAAGTELAVRAIWYLAKHGQVSMPRNDLGAGADRRSPDELVSGMLTTVRGIQQLVRVIEDGRDGQRAGHVLDDNGHVDMSGVGTAVALTDGILRSEIVPRSGPPVPPARNPREEFMDGVAELTRALNATIAADEQLRTIDDGHDEPMYQVEGVSPEQAADLVARVDVLRAHIREYEMNYRVAIGIRQQSTATGPSE